MVKYKLTFNKDEIKSTLQKIKTKESKIKYLTFLSEILSKIFFEYSDIDTIKLLKEYKLLDKFKENIKFKDKHIINERFRIWLNEEIRPFVGNSIANLKYDFDNSRYKGEQEKLNEKYPTYDFNDSLIIYRCNKDYSDYEERITYLEYVIQKFKIFFGKNAHEVFFDAIERPSLINFVSNLQTEIEKLKSEKVLFEKLNNKSETKSTKDLNKFKWQGTEKSILIILELFHSSKFISNEDYLVSLAILRDTFLNKEGKPFNNTQLSVTRKRMDKKQDNEIIEIGDDDYNKFTDMLKNLKKYIKN